MTVTERSVVAINAASGAHAERRLRMLKAALADNGALTVAEAASLTGASAATAARDLSTLADTVGAQRVRGGVVVDENDRAGRDLTAGSVIDASDALDLVRLAVNHAEQAAWSLRAGDVSAAQVHAQLAQAMATLSAARGPRTDPGPAEPGPVGSSTAAE